jgi:hypothetical protein
MDILKRLEIILNESVSRYCHIYLAKNKKWYMELASDEYGDRRDATTYGPFRSMKDADKYLENFANPGGLSVDSDGVVAPPKESPNGRPVHDPEDDNRRGWRY